MGKLTEMINNLFGVRTTSHHNPVVAALQIVSTKFLNVNDDRLGFLIVNLGANVAYILNNPDVSAVNGIMVGANGGAAHLIYKEDFTLVGDNWFGMAPGGPVNIMVLEVEGF